MSTKHGPKSPRRLSITSSTSNTSTSQKNNHSTSSQHQSSSNATPHPSHPKTPFPHSLTTPHRNFSTHASTGKKPVKLSPNIHKKVTKKDRDAIDFRDLNMRLKSSSRQRLLRSRLKRSYNDPSMVIIDNSTIMKQRLGVGSYTVLDPIENIHSLNQVNLPSSPLHPTYEVTGSNTGISSQYMNDINKHNKRKSAGHDVDSFESYSKNFQNFDQDGHESNPYHFEPQYGHSALDSLSTDFNYDSSPIFNDVILPQAAMDRVSKKILRFRRYLVENHTKRRFLLNLRRISVQHSTATSISQANRDNDMGIEDDLFKKKKGKIGSNGTKSDQIDQYESLFDTNEPLSQHTDDHKQSPSGEEHDDSFAFDQFVKSMNLDNTSSTTTTTNAPLKKKKHTLNNSNEQHEGNNLHKKTHNKSSTIPQQDNTNPTLDQLDGHDIEVPEDLKNLTNKSTTTTQIGLDPNFNQNALDTTQSDENGSNKPNQPISLNSRDISSLFGSIPAMPSKSFVKFDSSDSILSAIRTIVVPADKCTPRQHLDLIGLPKIQGHGFNKEQQDGNIPKNKTFLDDSDDDIATTPQNNTRPDFTDYESVNQFFSNSAIPWANKIHLAYQKHDYTRVLRLFELENLPLLREITEKLWVLQHLINNTIKDDEKKGKFIGGSEGYGDFGHFYNVLDQLLAKFPHFYDIVDLVLPPQMLKQYHKLYREYHEEQHHIENEAKIGNHNNAMGSSSYILSKKSQNFRKFFTKLELLNICPLHLYHPLLLPSSHDVNDSIMLSDQYNNQSMGDENAHLHHFSSKVRSTFGHSYTATSVKSEYLSLGMKLHLQGDDLDLFMQGLDQHAEIMGHHYQNNQANSQQQQQQQKLTSPTNSNDPFTNPNTLATTTQQTRGAHLHHLIPTKNRFPLNNNDDDINHDDQKEPVHGLYLHPVFTEMCETNDLLSFSIQNIEETISLIENTKNFDHFDNHFHVKFDIFVNQWVKFIKNKHQEDENYQNNDTFAQHLLKNPEILTTLDSNNPNSADSFTPDYDTDVINEYNANMVTLSQYDRDFEDLTLTQKISLSPSIIKKIDKNNIKSFGHDGIDIILGRSEDKSNKKNNDLLVFLAKKFLQNELSTMESLLSLNTLEINEFKSITSTHVMPESTYMRFMQLQSNQVHLAQQDGDNIQDGSLLQGKNDHKNALTLSQMSLNKEDEGLLRLRTSKSIDEIDTDHMNKYGVSKYSLHLLLTDMKSRRSNDTKKVLKHVVGKLFSPNSSKNKNKSSIESDDSLDIYELSSSTSTNQDNSSAKLGEFWSNGNDIGTLLISNQLLSTQGRNKFSNYFNHFQKNSKNTQFEGHNDISYQIHNDHRSYNNDDATGIKADLAETDHFNTNSRTTKLHTTPSSNTTKSTSPLPIPISIQSNLLFFPFTIQDPKMTQIIALSYAKTGLISVSRQVISSHLKGAYLTDITATRTDANSIASLRQQQNNQLKELVGKMGDQLDFVDRAIDSQNDKKSKTSLNKFKPKNLVKSLEHNPAYTNLLHFHSIQTPNDVISLMALLDSSLTPTQEPRIKTTEVHREAYNPSISKSHRNSSGKNHHGAQSQGYIAPQIKTYKVTKKNPKYEQISSMVEMFDERDELLLELAQNQIFMDKSDELLRDLNGRSVKEAVFWRKMANFEDKIDKYNTKMSKIRATHDFLVREGGFEAGNWDSFAFKLQELIHATKSKGNDKTLSVVENQVQKEENQPTDVKADDDMSDVDSFDNDEDMAEKQIQQNDDESFEKMAHTSSKRANRVIKMLSTMKKNNDGEESPFYRKLVQKLQLLDKRHGTSHSSAFTSPNHSDGNNELNVSYDDLIKINDKDIENVKNNGFGGIDMIHRWTMLQQFLKENLRRDKEFLQFLYNRPLTLSPHLIINMDSEQDGVNMKGKNDVNKVIYKKNGTIDRKAMRQSKITSIKTNFRLALELLSESHHGEQYQALVPVMIDNGDGMFDHSDASLVNNNNIDSSTMMVNLTSIHTQSNPLRRIQELSEVQNDMDEQDKKSFNPIIIQLDQAGNQITQPTPLQLHLTLQTRTTPLGSKNQLRIGQNGLKNAQGVITRDRNGDNNELYQFAPTPSSILLYHHMTARRLYFFLRPLLRQSRYHTRVLAHEILNTSLLSNGGLLTQGVEMNEVFLQKRQSYIENFDGIRSLRDNINNTNAILTAVNIGLAKVLGLNNSVQKKGDEAATVQNGTFSRRTKKSHISSMDAFSTIIDELTGQDDYDNDDIDGDDNTIKKTKMKQMVDFSEKLDGIDWFNLAHANLTPNQLHANIEMNTTLNSVIEQHALSALSSLLAIDPTISIEDFSSTFNSSNSSNQDSSLLTYLKSKNRMDTDDNNEINTQNTVLSRFGTKKSSRKNQDDFASQTLSRFGDNIDQVSPFIQMWLDDHLTNHGDVITIVHNGNTSNAVKKVKQINDDELSEAEDAEGVEDDDIPSGAQDGIKTSPYDIIFIKNNHYSPDNNQTPPVFAVPRVLFTQIIQNNVEKMLMLRHGAQKSLEMKKFGQGYVDIVHCLQEYIPLLERYLVLSTSDPYDEDLHETRSFSLKEQKENVFKQRIGRFDTERDDTNVKNILTMINRINSVDLEPFLSHFGDKIVDEQLGLSEMTMKMLLGVDQQDNDNSTSNPSHFAKRHPFEARNQLLRAGIEMDHGAIDIEGLRWNGDGKEQDEGNQDQDDLVFIQSARRPVYDSGHADMKTRLETNATVSFESTFSLFSNKKDQFDLESGSNEEEYDTNNLDKMVPYTSKKVNLTFNGYQPSLAVQMYLQDCYGVQDLSLALDNFETLIHNNKKESVVEDKDEKLKKYTPNSHLLHYLYAGENVKNNDVPHRVQNLTRLRLLSTQNPLPLANGNTTSPDFTSVNQLATLYNQVDQVKDKVSLSLPVYHHLMSYFGKKLSKLAQSEGKFSKSISSAQRSELENSLRSVYFALFASKTPLVLSDPSILDIQLGSTNALTTTSAHETYHQDLLTRHKRIEFAVGLHQQNQIDAQLATAPPQFEELSQLIPSSCPRDLLSVNDPLFDIKLPQLPSNSIKALNMITKSYKTDVVDLVTDAVEPKMTPGMPFDRDAHAKQLAKSSLLLDTLTTSQPIIVPPAGLSEVFYPLSDDYMHQVMISGRFVHKTPQFYLKDDYFNLSTSILTSMLHTTITKFEPTNDNAEFVAGLLGGMLLNRSNDLNSTDLHFNAKSTSNNQNQTHNILSTILSQPQHTYRHAQMWNRVLHTLVGQLSQGATTGYDYWGMNKKNESKNASNKAILSAISLHPSHLIKTLSPLHDDQLANTDHNNHNNRKLLADVIGFLVQELYNNTLASHFRPEQAALDDNGNGPVLTNNYQFDQVYKKLVFTPNVISQDHLGLTNLSRFGPMYNLSIGQVIEPLLKLTQQNQLHQKGLKKLGNSGTQNQVGQSSFESDMAYDILSQFERKKEESIALFIALTNTDLVVAAKDNTASSKQDDTVQSHTRKYSDGASNQHENVTVSTIQTMIVEHLKGFLPPQSIFSRHIKDTTDDNVIKSSSQSDPFKPLFDVFQHPHHIKRYADGKNGQGEDQQADSNLDDFDLSTEYEDSDDHINTFDDAVNDPLFSALEPMSSIDFGSKFLSSGGDDKNQMVNRIMKSLTKIQASLDTHYHDNVLPLKGRVARSIGISGMDDDSIINPKYDNLLIDTIFESLNPSNLYGKPFFINKKDGATGETQRIVNPVYTAFVMAQQVLPLLYRTGSSSSSPSAFSSSSSLLSKSKSNIHIPNDIENVISCLVHKLDQKKESKLDSTSETTTAQIDNIVNIYKTMLLSKTGNKSGLDVLVDEGEQDNASTQHSIKLSPHILHKLNNIAPHSATIKTITTGFNISKLQLLKDSLEMDKILNQSGDDGETKTSFATLSPNDDNKADLFSTKTNSLGAFYQKQGFHGVISIASILKQRQKANNEEKAELIEPIVIDGSKFDPKTTILTPANLQSMIDLVGNDSDNVVVYTTHQGLSSDGSEANRMIINSVHYYPSTLSKLKSHLDSLTAESENNLHIVIDPITLIDTAVKSQIKKNKKMPNASDEKYHDNTNDQVNDQDVGLLYAFIQQCSIGSQHKQQRNPNGEHHRLDIQVVISSGNVEIDEDVQSDLDSTNNQLQHNLTKLHRVTMNKSQVQSENSVKSDVNIDLVGFGEGMFIQNDSLSITPPQSTTTTLSIPTPYIDSLPSFWTPSAQRAVLAFKSQRPIIITPLDNETFDLKTIKLSETTPLDQKQVAIAPGRKSVREVVFTSISLVQQLFNNILNVDMLNDDQNVVSQSITSPFFTNKKNIKILSRDDIKSIVETMNDDERKMTNGKMIAHNDQYSSRLEANLLKLSPTLNPATQIAIKTYISLLFNQLAGSTDLQDANIIQRVIDVVRQTTKLYSKNINLVTLLTLTKLSLHDLDFGINSGNEVTSTSPKGRTLTDVQFERHTAVLDDCVGVLNGLLHQRRFLSSSNQRLLKNLIRNDSNTILRPRPNSQHHYDVILDHVPDDFNRDMTQMNDIDQNLTTILNATMQFSQKYNQTPILSQFSDLINIALIVNKGGNGDEFKVTGNGNITTRKHQYDIKLSLKPIFHKKKSSNNYDTDVDIDVYSQFKLEMNQGDLQVDELKNQRSPIGIQFNDWLQSKLNTGDLTQRYLISNSTTNNTNNVTGPLESLLTTTFINGTSDQDLPLVYRALQSRYFAHQKALKAGTTTSTTSPSESDAIPTLTQTTLNSNTTSSISALVPTGMKAIVDGQGTVLPLFNQIVTMNNLLFGLSGNIAKQVKRQNDNLKNIITLGLRKKNQDNLKNEVNNRDLAEDRITAVHDINDDLTNSQNDQDIQTNVVNQKNLLSLYYAAKMTNTPISPVVSTTLECLVAAYKNNALRKQAHYSHNGELSLFGAVIKPNNNDQAENVIDVTQDAPEAPETVKLIKPRKKNFSSTDLHAVILSAISTPAKILMMQEEYDQTSITNNNKRMKNRPGLGSLPCFYLLADYSHGSAILLPDDVKSAVDGVNQYTVDAKHNLWLQHIEKVVQDKPESINSIRDHLKPKDAQFDINNNNDDDDDEIPLEKLRAKHTNAVSINTNNKRYQKASANFGIVPLGPHGTLKFTKSNTNFAKYNNQGIVANKDGNGHEDAHNQPNTVDFHQVSLKSFAIERQILLKHGQYSAVIGSAHVEAMTTYSTLFNTIHNNGDYGKLMLNIIKMGLVDIDPKTGAMTDSPNKKLSKSLQKLISYTKHSLESSRYHTPINTNDLWVQYLGDHYAEMVEGLMEQINAPDQGHNLSENDLNTLTNQMLTTYLNVITVTLDQPVIEQQDFKLLSREDVTNTDKLAVINTGKNKANNDKDMKFDKIFKKFASKNTHVITPSFWNSLQSWLQSTAIQTDNTTLSNQSTTSSLLHKKQQHSTVYSQQGIDTLSLLSSVATMYNQSDFNIHKIALDSMNDKTADENGNTAIRSMFTKKKSARNFITQTAQYIQLSVDNGSIAPQLGQLLLTQMVIENNGYFFLPDTLKQISTSTSSEAPKKQRFGDNNKSKNVQTNQKKAEKIEKIEKKTESTAVQDNLDLGQNGTHLLSYLKSQVFQSTQYHSTPILKRDGIVWKALQFNSTKNPQQDANDDVKNAQVDQGKKESNKSQRYFLDRPFIKFQPLSVITPNLNSIIALGSLSPLDLSIKTTTSNPAAGKSSRPAHGNNNIYTSPLSLLRKNTFTEWIDVEAAKTNLVLNHTTHDHIDIANRLSFVRDMAQHLSTYQRHQNNIIDLIHNNMDSEVMIYDNSYVGKQSTPETTTTIEMVGGKTIKKVIPIDTNLSQKGPQKPSGAVSFSSLKEASRSGSYKYFSANVVPGNPSKNTQASQNRKQFNVGSFDSVLPLKIIDSTFLTPFLSEKIHMKLLGYIHNGYKYGNQKNTKNNKDQSPEDQPFNIFATKNAQDSLKSITHSLNSISTMHVGMNIVSNQLGTILQHQQSDAASNITNFNQLDTKFTALQTFSTHLAIFIAQNNIVTNNLTTTLRYLSKSSHFGGYHLDDNLPKDKYGKIKKNSKTNQEKDFDKNDQRLFGSNYIISNRKIIKNPFINGAVDGVEKNPHDLMTLLTPLRHQQSTSPEQNVVQDEITLDRNDTYLSADRVFNLSLPRPSQDLLTSSQQALENYKNCVSLMPWAIVKFNPQKGANLPVAHSLYSTLRLANDTLTQISPFDQEGLLKDNNNATEMVTHHALAKRAQVLSLYLTDLITNQLFTTYERHSVIEHNEASLEAAKEKSRNISPVMKPIKTTNWKRKHFALQRLKKLLGVRHAANQSEITSRHGVVVKETSFVSFLPYLGSPGMISKKAKVVRSLDNTNWDIYNLIASTTNTLTQSLALTPFQSPLHPDQIDGGSDPLGMVSGAVVGQNNQDTFTVPDPLIPSDPSSPSRILHLYESEYEKIPTKSVKLSVQSTNGQQPSLLTPLFTSALTPVVYPFEEQERIVNDTRFMDPEFEQDDIDRKIAQQRKDKQANDLQKNRDAKFVPSALLPVTNNVNSLKPLFNQKMPLIRSIGDLLQPNVSMSGVAQSLIAKLFTRMNPELTLSHLSLESLDGIVTNNEQPSVNTGSGHHIANRAKSHRHRHNNNFQLQTESIQFILQSYLTTAKSLLNFNQFNAATHVLIKAQALAQSTDFRQRVDIALKQDGDNAKMKKFSSEHNSFILQDNNETNNIMSNLVNSVLKPAYNITSQSFDTVELSKAIPTKVDHDKNEVQMIDQLQKSLFLPTTTNPFDQSFNIFNQSTPKNVIKIPKNNNVLLKQANIELYSHALASSTNTNLNNGIQNDTVTALDESWSKGFTIDSDKWQHPVLKTNEAKQLVGSFESKEHNTQQIHDLDSLVIANVVYPSIQNIGVTSQDETSFEQ